MMIGLFQPAPHGFSGRIRTLVLDAEISIVPAQTNNAENAPAWRVLLGDSDAGIEIGAGWNHKGERAGPFIAVQIDDPTFLQPLRANLFRSTQNKDVHHLLWSRTPANDRK